MGVKYYRNESRYMGAFDDCTPPNGGIECPAPPNSSAIWDGEAWVEMPTKEYAIAAINLAAGDARLKVMEAFVSPGFGTLDEYNNTALEVKRWRNFGSPTDDVPESITAWAIPKGLTNEQAAADLEAQEDFLRSKLDAIRTLRLAGIVATDNAISDWDAVAQPHINALNNYDPLA